MPRNPHKRPCQMPGCKAWAVHGGALCASHQGSRAIGREANLVLPLLRLAAGGSEAIAPSPAAQQATSACGDVQPTQADARATDTPQTPDATASATAASAADLALIEEELRQLLAARALFMEWLQSLRAGQDPEHPVVTPTQFIRAWSDTSTRVVQLLRARAELRGDQSGALDALLAGVYQELEGVLDAASPAATGKEGGDGQDRDRE